MSDKYIYQPKGKAREYAEWALNLYDGCEHRCQYCYVPAVLHRTREAFGHAMPKNIDWTKLEREIKALPKGSEVLMSFTCDPYQILEKEAKITRRAIELLHAHEVGVKILTKGGRSSLADIDLLAAKRNLSSYGVTLTFSDETNSRDWEPRAALPQDRVNCLAIMHEAGINTWVSFEPVIDPQQTLYLIKTSAPYADLIKIGRWNYDKRSNEIDWTAFLVSAIDMLRDLGKSYYIKTETRPFLPAGYAAEWDGK